MYGLSSTTYALQTAFYILHTYSYQHMNFPTTLQHKKTQLLINSSTDIRFDLVLFYYFFTPQQILIASIILLLLQQTHPFLVLFSYSKEIDPIYLLIPSLTFSVLDLIAFLSFLVTINPITYLLASLTHSRSDCLIPTR
jgi:hypothetical protein